MPWSNNGYRRLWLAAVFSRTGDTINFAALPLFVLALTHSAPAVATTVLPEGVGLIAGGILAQSIVDWLPPRRLMVSLDLARATVAALLVTSPSFPTALAVSLLLAIGMAFFSPLSNTIVPRLVPDRALPAANRLQWRPGFYSSWLQHRSAVCWLALAPLGWPLRSTPSAF